MREWAKNAAGKVSHELLVVLSQKGYVYIDETNGTPVMRLTALQKEQSIQSVSAWFQEFYPLAAPALMGELRQNMRFNGIKDLVDQSESTEDERSTWNFKNFLRPREKREYPQGTILDKHGRKIT